MSGSAASGTACVVERLPVLTRFRAPAILPPDAYSLLRGDAFATPSWYDTVIEDALPPNTEPIFIVLSLGGRAITVWPLQRRGNKAGALTTPYTSLWHPLTAPGLGIVQLRQAGLVLGKWCRPHGAVRLDCLEPKDTIWPPLIAGLRQAGLRVLPFDHFGNWHATTAGQSWETYLAARPGALREAIRRRTKKAADSGATCRIITGGAALEPAIAAYEAIYAKSWKQPEPFPNFNASLIRACAANGSLRLGLLELHNTAIAAQFWIVRESWAGVLKLAHDEAHKALSPGTVLTAHIIRHLLDVEHIAELDFGRGDDPYKKDWAPQRRQRTGLILANPWRLSGMVAVARSAVRAVVRRLRRGALPLAAPPPK